LSHYPADVAMIMRVESDTRDITTQFNLAKQTCDLAPLLEYVKKQTEKISDVVENMLIPAAAAIGVELNTSPTISEEIAAI